jgi:hypothetical protein
MEVLQRMFLQPIFGRVSDLRAGYDEEEQMVP